MLFSMTGYAVHIGEYTQGGEQYHLSLELKSVNARFFDVRFRIPESLRAFEVYMRDYLAQSIYRGKLDCSLQILGQKTQSTGALRTESLDDLSRLQSVVLEKVPMATPLSVADILGWPNVFDKFEPDHAVLMPTLQDLAAKTLDDFQESRQREGDKLAQNLLACIEKIRAHVVKAGPCIPAAQASYQDKLQQRLQDAFSQIGKDQDLAAIAADTEKRLLQEVALFAARIDVAEEISRLEAHIDEVERVIQAGGVCGKRLDFLAQELHREANTLGSKSTSYELVKIAMEIKLLIEQIREQVQNIQ